MSDTHPVKLEIYRSLLVSVAEEMGTVLRRTSFSPNIKERRDYSCAVFDSEGEVLAMGDHMPVHLGAMPMSVRAAIEEFDLNPGDVVVLNDPYNGGTHLPDITMILAVFEPGLPDRPMFYAASRAHHSDVGGMSPGSMPMSREIFQEGIRIPPVRLYKEGALDSEILELILANVRTPVEREGDLAAQVASLKIAEKRLLELVQRNGREEVTDYVAALHDYAERVMRGLLSEIPDGRYEAEDVLDDDGTEDRGSRQGVKIRVALNVQEDRLQVDFSGTEPQVAGCMNAVEAIVISAVQYVLRCLAPSDLPSCAGLMRPVEVVVPEGTVVNALYPAATAAGNVETSQRIVDTLLLALAEALPDRIPAASSGTMNNLSIGVIHPVTRQLMTYYETIGGGMGAGPAGPGDSGVHTHMTNSLNTPIEALEQAFPFRVREYRLRSGSGGRGVHNGGDGIVRSIELLTEGEATILSERRRHGPYGLQGGRTGKRGLNQVSARGRRKRLSGKVSVLLSAGDILTIETPGGGGWGTGSTPREPTGRRRGQSRSRRSSG